MSSVTTGRIPCFISTSYAKNPRSFWRVRNFKVIFICELAHQLKTISGGRLQSGIGINIPSYEVYALKSICTVKVPHFLEFTLKLGCISSSAATRTTRSAYFGYLPLLRVGGGVQRGPLHVGAAGGALGGQVLGLVGVQLDAVKAAAQRLEVDVGIAVGGIDITVPGGGVGVQHIPGVVHALDLLPGTQAGDGPLLVVAARVVPDVHVGSAADGRGRSHVQGPAAAGMRGNFVSCHIKYLLIIFYP